MSVDLVYFTVEGQYLDVENPPLSGSSATPTVNTISGFVQFFPRVPLGTVLYISNFDLTQTSGGTGTASTAVALAPIQARILSGVLQTIDTGDEPTIQLLANSTPISNALIAQGISSSGVLYYDVQYSSVIYSAAAQEINNFGFIAPTSSTTISITDPGLAMYPYLGPVR